VLNEVVVPVTDPCKGEIELPSLRPIFFREEWVRNKLESKLGIPYEKGVSATLWIGGTMFRVADRMLPLSEVVGLWTSVVLIGGYGGGDVKPPPMKNTMGV
jgi:hypothetical protein